MKKQLIMILLILLLLAFFACDADPYTSQRPTDQKGTYWNCQEYNIDFFVDQDGVTTGVITNGVKEIPVTLLWSALDNSVMFVANYSETESEMTYDVLLDGRCKFAEDSCDVEILNDYLGLYPEDRLPTLNFVRQEDAENRFE